MTASTLLQGVDVKNGAYRVRKMIRGRKFFKEGIATADEANAIALKWEQLRAQGLTPDRDPDEDGTLRSYAEKLLVRKASAVSRKTKRKLTEKGLEDWRVKTRPWREGEFAQLPVSMLRRAALEDTILARAIDAAKTAGDELDGLKATLRLARERGARFDESILEIDRPARTPRQRMALTVDELDYFVERWPDYLERLPLFKGTVGNRINELLTLTDDRVDLDEQAIFIPAHLNKEKVDKWIELTSEETALLREQKVARAPGTRLMFPKREGGQFTHAEFLRVWNRTRRRAHEDWLEERGLPDDAESPFGWKRYDEHGEPVLGGEGREAARKIHLMGGLTPHDLRATAATLMRDLGFTREEAAARLGHADSGELLDRIYDQGDRRARMRNAIVAKAPDGVRAGLKADERDRRSGRSRSQQVVGARPSARPAAQPTTLRSVAR